MDIPVTIGDALIEMKEFCGMAALEEIENTLISDSDNADDDEVKAGLNCLAKIVKDMRENT